VNGESDQRHPIVSSFKRQRSGTTESCGGRDAQLSFEGAAEYYWSMLIEPLQQ
jgi:hypothetical protein